MKDLKVSNETHSLLFSLKNKLIVEHNKKFTFDEVLKFLLEVRETDFESLNGMYQLEEKP